MSPGEAPLGASEGPPEGAPASFLVSSSESVDETPSDLRISGSGRLCPRRPVVVVCDQSPDLRFPASCDRYGCAACGPRKALGTAALAAWAVRRAPRARFVTGTLAPEDWQQRRQKVRDLRRCLRRRGFAWEMAWTTERGSATGMVHVHGLQHGDYVPGAVLNEVWGARTNIQAVKTGGVAQYVTKDALRVAGYAVKGTSASPDGLHEHLSLNGGRAMHWSRGFLHGLDKREAAAALRAELNASGAERTWHLERPTCLELTEGVARP